LIEGEDLNQLIKYAGGLNDDAIRKIIQVERIENDRKIALDVPYEQLVSKGGDFALKKGDKVVVFSIKTEVEDQIFVKGEVAHHRLINILKE
jgi:protein involved in polysaccharide export with SLBB domain